VRSCTEGIEADETNYRRLLGCVCRSVLEHILIILPDYLSSNNESQYEVMRVMSDLGTPYGYRRVLRSSWLVLC
jgi:hypothetical protein